MDILRFITAGSVDDGKSTLIGRLLFDSKSIMVDHLEALENNSKKRDDGQIDLALLTDGLRAEREQGITIDVAYKYFSTPKRKFIIADAPGHIQYTRNMVTGASNAELIIILIDARQGVIEQTKRHAIIASLLNIKHVVVAINKMDLVQYSEEVYNNIVEDFEKLAAEIGISNPTFIPISALNGDNIVDASTAFNWYKGETLLHFLETVSLDRDINLLHSRFPVQYVIRPQTDSLHDYRGYAGKIISGVYKQGDAVTILPSFINTTISKIEIAGQPVEAAYAPQSVIIHLADDVDVSRGDVIVLDIDLPSVEQQFDALICWMDTKPLAAGNKYLFQINSTRVKCVVKAIEYKLNVNTLEKDENVSRVGLNDIIRATIKTAQPIAFDSYQTLKANGGAILIDETSNITVGACMIQ